MINLLQRNWRRALSVVMLIVAFAPLAGCEIRIDRDDGTSIEDRATQAALDWLEDRFGDD